MQSMVNRWKNSIQERPPTINTMPPHPPKQEQTINNDQQSQINSRKELEKSKKSLHSHEGKIQSSKRLTTPSKRKSKNNKSNVIENACDQIFQIFAKASASDKTVAQKIKNVLEIVWSKSLQTAEAVSPRNAQTATQMETSILRQSTMSASAAKRHQRLYIDLQKRYFDCEKEKLFLKAKVEQIIKKYEGVEKQLERSAKIEKLIQSTIQREDELRVQNKRLKNELQLSQLRQIQQQKMFEQEVNIVRELVDEIRKNLPTT